MQQCKESLKKESLSQELRHLSWLRSLGFSIDILEVDCWLKCRGAKEVRPSGSYAYKTFANKLDNGGYGLVTVAKVHGKKHKFATLPELESRTPFVFRLSQSFKTSKPLKDYDKAARKAELLWSYSVNSGQADYLARKGVGAYGIRFKETDKYGRCAVVPMRDIEDKLFNLQFLNANGSKIFVSEARVNGLFHCLAPIVNGKPFGIAESYVTAATCLELSGLPTACCFGCNNMERVAKELSNKYPASPVIFFADNDRHLDENQGILKATQAIKAIDKGILAFPVFDGAPSKDKTDWNDLVRIHGNLEAKDQILKYINKIM